MNTKNKKLNIAIAGLGFGKKVHLEALKDSDYLTPVAIYHYEKKQKSILEKETGLDFFHDWVDLVKSPEIDGIIIATPPESRFKLAKSALENNKNLLLEKPVSISSLEIEELQRISLINNLRVCVDFEYRAVPLFLQTKKLLADKENHNWRTFTDLIKILNHFGCLNDLELTEVGQTVGAIRSENELWIGLVLVSGYLDDLDPPDLAAIIQAICVDVRRPNLWCNFKPSLKVIDVFNELDGLRKLVASQQNKFHIEIPIYLETELTGIISEWARGKKWKDLVFNTSLDEGDVVRIIRRSIDVLSQVQYCIGVSNKLKSKAKLALKAINRFPVSESNDLIKVSEDINPATKRIDNNA